MRWLIQPYPRNRHARGESFQCPEARTPFKKDTQWSWRGFLSTSPDSRCEASLSEPLPTEQLRVAILITVLFLFFVYFVSLGDKLRVTAVRAL